MKKILLTLGLAGLLSSQVVAQTITEAFTVAGGVASIHGVTNLINAPCSVSRIVLIFNGPMTVPHNYAVVDAPKNNVGGNLLTTAVLEATNTISAMVSYTTNISILVTNYEGSVTNLYRSNVLYSTWGTAAATRNPYKRLVVGSTSAAGTITVFDNATSPLRFANGLTFTNTVAISNATAVITYDPAL